MINVNEKIEIFNCLSHAEGATIDKCYAVYSRIIKGETLEQQAEHFKCAYVTFGTKQSTKELIVDSIIGEQERETLLKTWESMLTVFWKISCEEM